MGKKNDVPKDIAEMIINSVNDYGKVDDWKLIKTGDWEGKRCFIKTDNVNFVVEKNVYFRPAPFPNRKGYNLKINGVDYEGKNVHRIFDTVEKNYEEKYVSIEKQKTKEMEEAKRKAAEEDMRKKMKSTEEELRKQLSK